MLKFLIFCLVCYFLFLLGSLLLPLFIVFSIIILVFYGLKAFFDLLTHGSVHRYYRNPIARLIVNIWQGFIHLVYQLVFTITKAINDGKDSYKK